MKCPSHPFSLLIPFLLINSVYGQKESLHTVSQLIEQISLAVKNCDPCHYSAQMRFKDMTGDTFEIRNFSVSWRSNPANQLYGYDWEVSEILSTGDAYTFMMLSNEEYTIYEGDKIMVRHEQPKKIDLSNIAEYLRSFLILDEVFNPFNSAFTDKIVVKDSSNYYYLSRKMNDIATRQLVISKNTYLPVQSTSLIKGGEFNINQITEINFFYDDQLRILPDTAFSPEHYVSLGYTFPSEQSSASSRAVNYLSSAESIEFLLYYPLVTPTGDTTSLMALEAPYMLLDFWYASCMPCLKALPEINQLAEDYRGDGLQVIGVNCFDMDNMKNVESKIREKDITIPLYFGSRDLTETLQINSFPSYVLITPDRQVKFIHGSSDDVRKVIQEIFKQ